MKNKMLIGNIAIILGSLLLSVEYYLLTVVRSLDYLTGSMHTNTMSYMTDQPIKIAFLISYIVVFYGLSLVVWSVWERYKLDEKNHPLNRKDVG